MTTTESNEGHQSSKPEAELDLNDILLQRGQRIVHSKELLQGERELIVLHGSLLYRLMETKNGKLILQK